MANLKSEDIDMGKFKDELEKTIARLEAIKAETERSGIRGKFRLYGVAQWRKVQTSVSGLMSNLYKSIDEQEKAKQL